MLSTFPWLPNQRKKQKVASNCTIFLCFISFKISAIWILFSVSRHIFMEYLLYAMDSFSFTHILNMPIIWFLTKTSFLFCLPNVAMSVKTAAFSRICSESLLVTMRPSVPSHWEVTCSFCLIPKMLHSAGKIVVLLNPSSAFLNNSVCNSYYISVVARRDTAYY